MAIKASLPSLKDGKRLTNTSAIENGYAKPYFKLMCQIHMPFTLPATRTLVL